MMQSKSGKTCSRAYSSIRLYPVPPQGGDKKTALNYLFVLDSGKRKIFAFVSSDIKLIYR